MKTKLTLLALLGAIGVLTAPASFAAVSPPFDGSLKINKGSFQNGVGGEFQVASSKLGTFQTFCLEVTEDLQFGGTYAYNKNDGAVQGGSGTWTPLGVDSRTSLPKDFISIGVAWLYSQFAHGTLPTYFGSNRKANAGLLQQAIWYLENESLGVNNAYVTLAAKALFNSTTPAAIAKLTQDSHGAYGVIALNLFNGPGSTTVKSPNGITYRVNQDVLAIIPEPSTVIAGALLLLPFGVSTFRIIRKNRVA